MKKIQSTLLFAGAFWGAAICPLLGQTNQGVLREVWSNLSGTNISSLTDSPNFPNQPILQVIDSDFAAPVNFGSRYGVRMRALLKPTISGSYTFWVSGDDNCELWLGDDDSFRSAALIANVPSWTEQEEWDKYEQQQSEPVALVAGQSYYIEALMKENSGGDHLSVGWAMSSDAVPAVIAGEYLTPLFQPEAASSESLIVIAGEDAHYYAPRSEAYLAVQALDTIGGQTPEVSWSLISGPEAVITSPSEFLTGVTLSDPGVYVFEVTATASGLTETDQTVITLGEPLHPDAGQALTEYWYSLFGDLSALSSEPTYPSFPHAFAVTDNISTPRRVNDYYGSRTSGYLLIPEEGLYQFYLSADAYGEFWLDTGSGLTRHCEVAAAVGSSDYQVSAEQGSEELFLAAGAYPFEILQKDDSGTDFFSLVWRRPDGEYLEEITGEFLALPEEAGSVMSTVTEYDSTLDYSVYAGADQTVYFPNATASLEATIRRRISSETATFSWSLVSGPGEVEFSSSWDEETEVSFAIEGAYRLRFSVETEHNVSSDDLIVEVAPELSSETGFLTREVWFGSYETLADFVADPDYPANPDIVTQVPALVQASNWSSNYGTRLTGTFIVPPSPGDETVEYTFTVSGDDVAQFSISSDENEANLAPVCVTESATALGQILSESQVSAPIALVPGERYFIELLHKEEWSRDVYGVAWTTAKSPDLAFLSGSLVESSGEGRIHDDSVRFYANAGEDRTFYWPHEAIEMEGSHYRVSGSDDDFSYYWQQTSGPEATIVSPREEDSTVLFSQPGVYEFALKVKYDGVTHFDEVTVTIEEPQEGVNGYLTRSLWFDYDQRDFSEILEADPELAFPHFEDLFPGVETPQGFSNYYGTRLEGFLTLPQSGDYVFTVISRDIAVLEIDLLDGAGYQTLAEYSSYSSFRNFDSGAVSEAIALEAGERYPIRVLHKDRSTSEHLSIALEGPATNGREVLSPGFLSPLRDAPLHNPEMTLSAGPDQLLLWPNDRVTLAGLVYDLEDGPEPLAYQWTASSEEVSISGGDQPAAHFIFPGPGLYELFLTASDGVHEESDSLIVTVADPLSVQAGGLLREVWTNISGSTITALTSAEDYPDSPDFSFALTDLETPAYWGENYGQRLRGYLSVPADGEYELLVASDDQSEVWLNVSGEDFAGLELVANAPSATGRYNYAAYPDEQVSAPLSLQAGVRYALEVLHKEGVGGDYLNVAYRLAGSTDDPITIPGALLSPPAGVVLPDDGNGLHVNSGDDFSTVWPTNVFQVSGVALDDAPGPQPLSYVWSVLDGAESKVLIHDPTLVSTGVTVVEPGHYTLQLTVTDGVHFASDQLNLSVAPAVAEGTGSILCEVYEEVSGSTVISLKNSEKFPQAPDSSVRLTSTQYSDLGDSYGIRLRGYLHPEVTGLYQFNLTSDDWSEAFLSSDESEENIALVGLVPEAMDYDEWRRHPEYQVSAKIELQAGEKYYLEIRHKESGWRDHMSFAWLTPGAEAFEVIDGAFLSPVDTGDVDAPVINLVGSESVVVTVGSDYADPGFVALDGTEGDLTSQVRVEGVVDTAVAGDYLLRYYVTDAAGNEALVASRRVQVLSPDELEGSYDADQSGSYTEESYEEPEDITLHEAARFLKQASFGPSVETVARVQEVGYEGWLAEQLELPFTSHVAEMERHALYQGARDLLLEQSAGMDSAMEGALPGSQMVLNTPSQDTDDRLWSWWTLSATADDQLRQRVAFALSEILVISDSSPALASYPLGVANYYDLLGEYAFGNYRDLLHEVTLNPMMGIWLTMVRSDQAQPDENYAREVLQLFSLGLNRLNLDGTLQYDGNGSSIPTYTENDVQELARALTGWTFAESTSFYDSGSEGANELTPLIPFEDFHDKGEKVLMGGATIPAGMSAAEDVSRAIDIIFNHPNLAPFVSRQLIQRLITSNPSSAYVYRVSLVFEDNGQGERGDMGAVIKAILLDPEARELSSDVTVGKLSEPLLRPLRLMRAFPKAPSSNPPILGRYMLSNTSDDLAQSPMQANSVFNFFPPDHQEPGVLMEAGLVAPEFQITTEITTTTTANYLFEAVQYGFPTYYLAGKRVEVDKSILEDAWGRPEVLLGLLEERLLARAMSETARTSLLEVHAAYEGRTSDGVDAMLQVILASPEFSIDR